MIIKSRVKERTFIMTQDEFNNLVWWITWIHAHMENTSKLCINGDELDDIEKEFAIHDLKVSTDLCELIEDALENIKTRL